MERPLSRERMLDWATLAGAYHRARRGKRHTPSAGEWFIDWEARLAALRDRLAEGYRFGPYRRFLVRDPKVREVAAAPFADRIVHHAIVECVEAVCERRLLSMCVACRKGKGLKAARSAVTAAARNPANAFFLKCDVRAYFASIRHDAMLAMLSRLCADDWSMGLLETLLDSWHSPAAQGTGIPIGNLTSQLFANLYLSGVDLFMTRTAGARGYVRYVDDILWFGDEKAKMWSQLALLRNRLAPLGLQLHPAKTRVGLVARGVDFAGLVVTPTTIRLRGATKRRSLRHLRALRRARRLGEVDMAQYLDRVQSLVALAGFVPATGLVRSMGLAW